MASGEKLNTDFTDLNWYKRQQRQSMGRAHPICMSEMQGKAELWAPNLHQSYILHLILHPILHPKSPINTGRLGHGCRKCRIFSKTFFSGRRKAVLCKTKTRMDIPTSWDQNGKRGGCNGEPYRFRCILPSSFSLGRQRQLRGALKISFLFI